MGFVRNFYNHARRVAPLDPSTLLRMTSVWVWGDVSALEKVAEVIDVMLKL